MKLRIKETGEIKELNFTLNGNPHFSEKDWLIDCEAWDYHFTEIEDEEDPHYGEVEAEVELEQYEYFVEMAARHEEMYDRRADLEESYGSLDIEWIEEPDLEGMASSNEINMDIFVERKLLEYLLEYLEEEGYTEEDHRDAAKEVISGYSGTLEDTIAAKKAVLEELIKSLEEMEATGE